SSSFFLLVLLEDLFRAPIVLLQNLRTGSPAQCSRSTAAKEQIEHVDTPVRSVHPSRPAERRSPSYTTPPAKQSRGPPSVSRSHRRWRSPSRSGRCRMI